MASKAIKSVTRRKVLFSNYEPAETTAEKARGLMFRRSIEKPLLFTFETEGRKRNSIHSLFCFCSFDAIFLDSDRKVVDIWHGIEPFSWKIFVPRAPAKYLIECGDGDAKRLKIRVGEKLNF